MQWENTAIGALDVDTTGALAFNDAVTAGSIALDGAADVTYYRSDHFGYKCSEWNS